MKTRVMKIIQIIGYLWLILIIHTPAFSQESVLPNEGKDKYSITNKSLVQALAANRQGRYSEADSLYAIASKKLGASLSDSVEYVYSLLAHSKLQLSLRNREEARKMLKDAGSFIQTHGIGHNIIQAYYYLQLAATSRDTPEEGRVIDAIDSALILYTRGRFQYEELFLDIARNKYYLYHDFVGQTDTLLKYLDIKEQLYRKHADRLNGRVVPAYRDQLYLEYGRTYMKQGDFGKAITYFLAASKSMEERGAVSSNEYLQAQLSLSIAYYYQIDYETGLKISKNAAKLAESVYPPGDVNRMNFYNLLGLYYNGLNQPEKAFEYFQKCEQLLRKNESEGTNYHIAILNLGAAQMRLGNYQQSESYFRQGLQGSQKLFGKRHPANAYFYHYMAQQYNATKDWLTALSYTDSAMQNMVPDYNGSPLKAPDLDPKSLDAAVLDELHTHIDFLLAAYANNQGGSQYLLALIDYTELVHEILAAKRESLEDYQSLLFNSQQYKSITENTLHALSSLYTEHPQEEYFSDVLNFMSLSKALLFNAELGEYQLLRQPNVPESLRKLYSESRQHIDSLNSEIERMMSLSISNDTIKTLNLEKMDWQANLASAKSQLKEMARTNTNPEEVDIDIEYIRKHFLKGPDQAYIEYFLGDLAIYAVGVSHKKASFKRIERDSVIDEHLDSFLKSFKEFEHDKPATEEQYARSAYYLYNRLFSPIESELDENLTKVTIVGDEQLAQLPFELLISEESNGKSFSELPYLIRQLDFSYALSSRIKAETPEAVTGKGILGIAYSGVGLTDSRASMGNIPGAFEEIAYLKKRFKGRYFVGDEGSKKVFLSEAGKYDIIHLAVHGQADLNDRFGSNLIFNGEGDYTLNSSDLYGILFNARMVILSACESALGEIKSGEGTYSVARGFASAGVPSIITTLWKVDDLAGATIITDFYGHIEQGMSKSEALKRAKLDYLSNANNLSAHPYYWGSFVIIGDALPLEIAKKVPRYHYLLVVIVLVLSLVVFLRKRRKAA